MAFQKVANANDIPAGEMEIVEVNGEEIVIANLGTKFVAFQNDCTHKQGPLGEGILEGNVVECPFHAGQFNVETGEVIASPPEEPIKLYPVQVEGDEISIDA